VEETLEVKLVAAVATIVANRHADADLLADIVSFAVRNLLADGASNLLDYFLAFITAGCDSLLLDDFTRNHAGNLDGLHFFAGLPGLDAIGATWDCFLYSGVFRNQALELGAQVAMLLGTRIVASVFAAATTSRSSVAAAAASVINVATALDANLLAHSVTGFLSLFGDPFTSANLNLLLFPNGIANDPLDFDLFGLVNGLAHHFTDFLHHCLVDSSVGSAGPLFGHSLPLVFITYLGGTTGVRSRGTSHDGGSATAATTVSHRCGVGTEDSCDRCNGRGKEIQAHSRHSFVEKQNRRTGHPGPGPNISPGGYSNVFKPIMRVTGCNAKEAE
jgi:hypothetical protein